MDPMMDVIINKYGYLVNELMRASYLADKIQEVYGYDSNHDHIMFLRNIPDVNFNVAPNYRTTFSQVERAYSVN